MINKFLIVVIIVLIYFLYRYMTKDYNRLTSLTSAKTLQKIEASELPYDNNGNNVNFTYSTWFFIDDWNYKYGEKKIIFGRMADLDAVTSNACPSLTLHPINNVATIDIAISSENTQLPLMHVVEIPNIPIQRWVNLTMSTNTGVLDVYMDGKLIRTSLLPGVPMVSTNAPIYITPLGGFSGWTSNFEYWPNSIGPNEAWKIYRNGYGGNWLSNLFGRYTVKISIMQGDTEESSVTI